MEEIKKLDATVSENDYLITEDTRPAAPKQKRQRKPHTRGGVISFLKSKLDIYDMLMIPVGIGLLAAFIALMFNIA